MFRFISRERNNPNISTAALPDDLYDPIHFSMHQRALRGTMYGIGDIVRTVIDEGRVKFQYVRSGKILNTVQEAFQEAGKDGVTTFSRLTGRLEDSSLNMRGLYGLEQRLIQMQQALRDNPSLAARLGIDDPSDLRFEVGTFKTGMGEKGTMQSIINRLGDGLIVPDDNEFNFLQVVSGTKKLSFIEIDRLFASTALLDPNDPLSGSMGGIFSRQQLIDSLKKGELGSLFSKSGKRFRGAIGLKDVSIAGDIMKSILEDAGIAGAQLSEKNVKIFRVSDDLTKFAAEYERLLTSGQKFSDLEMSRLVMGAAFDEEQRAFYGGGTRTISLVKESMRTAGILDDNYNLVSGQSMQSLTEKSQKLFKQSVEAQFDGTAVINSTVFRSIRKQMEQELVALESMEKSPQISARISELKSQLSNMADGKFQAITARIFLPLDKSPKMIKAVVDQANFAEALKKYAVVATDVVVKKEPGLMGSVSAMNLVLQGGQTGRVYYDPLAPAFHGNVFSSPSYMEAQQRRQARILQSFQDAVENGNISATLRQSIYRGADVDINALPASMRSSAERNKLYMRRLKDAIESGIDIRSMPNLLNYLSNYIRADLFREVDGTFQPAMEDAFRLAIDTEQSFFSAQSGLSDAERGFLGRGLRNFEMISQESGERVAMQALEFQVQGHKMLFGGNAAQIFKHSLGGFDLDDHGIVMPRIIQDASGNKRLGTFMFRQPTGPSEFIFGMPKFGNVDTIKLFFESNDALMNQLESMKNEDDFKLIYQAVNATDSQKRDLDRQLRILANQEDLAQGVGTIEQNILNIMQRAEQSGLYKAQTISSSDPVFRMMAAASSRTGEPVASPLQLTRTRVEELMSLGSDFLDEKFLVEQYNYGNIIRLFNESAKLEFDSETQSALKALIGNVDLTQESVGNEIERLQGLGTAEAQEKAERISSIVTELFQRKTREALNKSENIGQYINRMVVATASADQEEQIASALRAAGKGAQVDEILQKTVAGIISPSDVVDIITNMSGRQFLNANNLAYQQLAGLLEGSGQNLAAAQTAIQRILGQDISSPLSQQVAQAAIDAKFERLGRLRALAMEQGLDKNLYAGIDRQFLTERMKNQDDVMRAITALETGFQAQIESATVVSKEMSDYLTSIQSARKVKDSSATAELIRLVGLSVDSEFAHASKNAQVGRNAKQAFDALEQALYNKASMEYMGEVNMSRDASVIAENILNEFTRLSDESFSLISNIGEETGELSDFYSYEASLKRQQIGNKVRSMIIAGAEGVENVTVQDILDNMERLSFTSRYRRARNYQKLISGFGDENDIANLIEAARRAREIKFLSRQNMNSNLVDQLNDMVRTVRGMTNQERQEILQESKDLLTRYARMGVSISEDRTLAAALLTTFGEGDFLSSLGMTEEALAESRRILQMSNAQRALEDTGVSEILGYSRANAMNFAPQDIGGEDLDDARRLAISGLEESQVDEVNLPQYKRLAESWREGKLGEAFGNPIIKKSAYAAVGLIAASFIYSATKDRGESEISGPPLLPGGSAYEQMPQRQSQIPNPSMFSGYNPGTSYAVHLEGSQSQIESFRESAGSVARGPINSTMSRGIPQLGRDQYSQIASSF